MCDWTAAALVSHHLCAACRSSRTSGDGGVLVSAGRPRRYVRSYVRSSGLSRPKGHACLLMACHHPPIHPSTTLPPSIHHLSTTYPPPINHPSTIHPPPIHHPSSRTSKPEPLCAPEPVCLHPDLQQPCWSCYSWAVLGRQPLINGLLLSFLFTFTLFTAPAPVELRLGLI